MENHIPRSEFPRPDFRRENWLCLNGQWSFAFDDDGDGFAKGYASNKNLPLEITVPFCYQSKLSGIGDSSYHETVWYGREFSLAEPSACTLLKFGAVDYEAQVWVNGLYVGCHRGGHVQFAFDITHFVHSGVNTVALRVRDDRSLSKPRGKQIWLDKNERCWYTPTTGIWQSVWLEMTGSVHIEKLLLTPDIDRRCVQAEVFLSTLRQDTDLEFTVSYEGKPVKQLRISAKDTYIRELITLVEEDAVDEVHYWFPESPRLYEISLRLSACGQEQDRVDSYLGMRKIQCRGDMIYLNNKELYQRLVLDQGYWQDSLLTPPSDEAIRYDISMTKAFGFNGARKHQKFEDPRYYYWADKMGLLVWGELPSAYQFHNGTMENLTREWLAFLEQSFNHPCLITWVPLNESWGVRNIVSDKKQQQFAAGLYHMTKAFDPTRLVSTNDGWETVEATDIVGIHDYVAAGTDFERRYRNWEDFLKHGIPYRLPLALGQQYKGQPVLLTEYGGIAFADDSEENWGYSDKVNSQEAFLLRLRSITTAIRNTPYLRGFCYTQLTDVMQETNGLLTMERQEKIPAEKLQEIFGPG